MLQIIKLLFLSLLLSYCSLKSNNAGNSDLTNVTVNLTLAPDLKLVNGELSKTVASLKTDNSSELNFTVTPLKTGTYDINVLLNASSNGERIGTARTIRFQTSDYVSEKQPVHPSGLHIIEGKTDYGK